MLTSLYSELLCEEALQKIREKLDEPGLLAFERVEDIMEILRPLTRDVI